MEEDLKAFQRLSDILDTLRKDCPWDRQQTMKSLRYLTIEEVHELSEAIVAFENTETGSRKPETAVVTPSTLHSPTSDLKKELGDLAMHILFYCKLAEEQGLFSTADVYNAICDKLVARHPFIYDKEHYHGEGWEEIKMRERDRHGVLDGVPDSLPSLVKAIRMQEKVAGMEHQVPARPDALENLKNFKDPNHPTEEEFGDLLFGLVDWARRHGINADDALCGANRRFRQSHK